MAAQARSAVRAVQLPGRPRATATRGSVDAGFQECSNLGMEVTVAEYRNGNAKENGVMKITLLNKATDVTLKRGVIGLVDALRLAATRSATATRTRCGRCASS